MVQPKKKEHDCILLKPVTALLVIYSRAINEDVQSMQANGQSLKSCLLHIHIPLVNNLNVPKRGIV